MRSLSKLVVADKIFEGKLTGVFVDPSVVAAEKLKQQAK